jgi:predicted lipoprotein with Yx(FWY)xxD motif
MKDRLLTFTIVGLSVAALVGGVVEATSGGVGSVQSAGATSPLMVTTQPTAEAPSLAPTATPDGTTTVREAIARVGGVTETILVNAKGLPLYTYQPDTATQSMVTGELAALWPPLLSSAPTASGTSGAVGVVLTGNGRQVTYNGHFLYTFAEDMPGQVTGQGVQSFFVATPSLAPNHFVPISATPGDTPTNSAPAYGY